MERGGTRGGWRRRLVIAALTGLILVCFVAYLVTANGLGAYDTWAGVVGAMVGGWTGVSVLTLAVLNLASFVRRMVAGHPDWPEGSTFELTYDDNGLPVLTWLEDAFDHPRRCCIGQFAETGELAFLSTDYAPATDPRTVWKGRAIFGVIIGLSLLAGFASSLSYSYGQDGPPMMVAVGVFFWLSMMLAAYAVVRAIWWRWRLVTGRAPPGAINVAPWAALQGFVVTDSHSLYGARNSVGVERPKLPIMMADFGLEARRFEVSHHNWSADAQIELSRILTLEFLARRAEHMVRIAQDGFVAVDGSGSRGIEQDASGGIPVRLG